MDASKWVWVVPFLVACGSGDSSRKVVPLGDAGEDGESPSAGGAGSGGAPDGSGGATSGGAPASGGTAPVDAGAGGTHDRVLSGLFYLRDIAEGGETEFPFQLLRIRPQAGLLLLFPPFWTHLHRGVSPVSAVKYNITNFLVLRPAAPRPA